MWCSMVWGEGGLRMVDTNRYGPSRALIVSASRSSTACLYDRETPSRVPASP